MKRGSVAAGLAVGAAVGFLAGVVAVLAYPGIVYAMSTQTTVACRPSPPEGGASYCVYHRSTPGLLADGNQLLVGPSPGRGLVYEVPYGRSDISASWSPTTRAVTITMPGTQLTIEPAEYLDSR